MYFNRLLGRKRPGGLKPSHLDAEITKAKKFDPDLRHYIIATTDSRQKGLQDLERHLNEQQIQAGAFTFEIWFWEDFLGFLHKYSPLLQWYYDRILQLKGVYNLDHQILYLFSMAFSRPAFTTPLASEENGTGFFEALRDTATAINTGQLRDRESKGLLRAAPGGVGMLSKSEWATEIQETLSKVLRARAIYKHARDEGKIIEHPNRVEVRDWAIAQEIDQLRGDAIRDLNGILVQADLPVVVSPL